MFFLVGLVLKGVSKLGSIHIWGCFLPCSQLGWSCLDQPLAVGREHCSKPRGMQIWSWRIPMFSARMTSGIWIAASPQCLCLSVTCLWKEYVSCFSMFSLSFVCIKGGVKWCVPPEGEYATPESTTLFSHEHGRSLTETWAKIVGLLWFLFFPLNGWSLFRCMVRTKSGQRTRRKQRSGSLPRQLSSQCWRAAWVKSLPSRGRHASYITRTCMKETLKRLGWTS